MMLEEADEFAKLLCQLDAVPTGKVADRRAMRRQSLMNLGLLLEALTKLESEEEDPASPPGDMQMYSLRLSLSRSLGHHAAAYYTLARDEGPWRQG